MYVYTVAINRIRFDRLCVCIVRFRPRSCLYYFETNLYPGHQGTLPTLIYSSVRVRVMYMYNTYSYVCCCWCCCCCRYVHCVGRCLDIKRGPTDSSNSAKVHNLYYVNCIIRPLRLIRATDRSKTIIRVHQLRKARATIFNRFSPTNLSIVHPISTIFP